MLDRHALTYDAAQEAAAAREAAGLDQDTPICVYDLAAALGVKVRFVDIDMEGVYERGPPPRALLSPYRPLGRRAFNCAHEIGHHRFEHGSTVDELMAAGANRRQTNIPEEILANAFAAFVLMPTIGVRRAFNRRATSPAVASPLQIYTIACDFGVGYRTLVAHLSFSLDEIEATRRGTLERWTPQDLRRQALGRLDPQPLIILDDLGEARTLDVEIGSGVLAPIGSVVSNTRLVFERRLASGDLFRATCRGASRLQTSHRSIKIRIMPFQYIGLAGYRSMEAPDGEP
jgi:hypothetical protein